MVRKDIPTLILILKRVKEKIKQGWCQGAFARDDEGNIVNPTDASACRWCITGATRAVLYPELDGITIRSEGCSSKVGSVFSKLVPVEAILRESVSKLHPGFWSRDSLVHFNDVSGRKIWEILEVIDKSIVLLRKEMS